VADRDLLRLGDDLRNARMSAGLSLRFVADRADRSASHVMRIERGLVPGASVRELTRLGAVVGLDVRVRAYPGADPIRDVAQTRLLGRLTARLHPSLTVRHEVPLPIPGDLRAWDAWIAGFADSPPEKRGLAVDAETRLHDVQALLRRLSLKARDAGVDHVLLVVADTRSNRAAVAGAADVLDAMFPVPSRRTLAALAEGRYPGGSALLFL
jgi:transcriptional regulator with XRE-family HTH domain